MTNNPTIDGVPLLPCPFCGCDMRVESNRDWHRIFGAHAEDCVFDADNEQLMVPATPEQLLLMTSDWNKRALLDAPAVERQEPKSSQVPVLRAMAANYRNGHCWDFLDGEAVSKAADEITFLHSTIARLEARIAELESGMGEPIYELEYLGEGGGGWVETDKHQFDVTSKLKNFRTRIVFTAPPAPVAVPEKYDDVLLPFLSLMRAELHANAHKGDRQGWLQMDSKTAILEVFYHMGKLHQAVHRGEEAAIKEYAADVANMCMMLLDVCACLDATAALNGPDK